MGISSKVFEFYHKKVSLGKPLDWILYFYKKKNCTFFKRLQKSHTQMVAQLSYTFGPYSPVRLDSRQ